MSGKILEKSTIASTTYPQAGITWFNLRETPCPLPLHTAIPLICVNIQSIAKNGTYAWHTTHFAQGGTNYSRKGARYCPAERSCLLYSCDFPFHFGSLWFGSVLKNVECAPGGQVHASAGAVKLLQSEMLQRKNVAEVSREGHMEARERLIKELEQSARRAQQVLELLHQKVGWTGLSTLRGSPGV